MDGPQKLQGILEAVYTEIMIFKKKKCGFKAKIQTFTTFFFALPSREREREHDTPEGGFLCVK